MVDKEIINYVVNKKHGTKEDLMNQVLILVKDNYKKISQEDAIQKTNWYMNKLEYLGYIKQGQDINNNTTWKNTDQAKEISNLLRNPTFFDSIKGILLKHVLGYSVDL